MENLYGKSISKIYMKNLYEKSYELYIYVEAFSNISCGKKSR